MLEDLRADKHGHEPRSCASVPDSSAVDERSDHKRKAQGSEHIDKLAANSAISQCSGSSCENDRSTQ
ncbi:MAG: hypothetical protein NVS3B12_14830 [Acidimicrobiales bacterium]